MILYLSKSKLGDLYKKRRKLKISNIKSKFRFSLNPKINIEIDFEQSDKIEIPKYGKNEIWPPFNALTIITDIEKKLKKNNQIGTIDDLKNKNFVYPYYKLKGKLYADKEKNGFLYWLNKNFLKGIIVPDGLDKKIRIDISYDNLAGISNSSGKWEVMTSMTKYFLREISEEGCEIIGLFSYLGEKNNNIIDCSALYFTKVCEVSYFDKKEKEIIGNEYLK